MQTRRYIGMIPCNQLVKMLPAYIHNLIAWEHTNICPGLHGASKESLALRASALSYFTKSSCYQRPASRQRPAPLDRHGPFYELLLYWRPIPLPLAFYV